MERFFRHPKVIVVVIACITLFFLFQLPSVELDNNNFRFLPDKLEERLVSDYIEETFGSSVSILVGLERPLGSVFEPQFLRQIDTFVKQIAEFDVVGDISSIMTTDYITAEGDAIVVTDLVDEDFTGTAEEIARLKRRIASWDLYEGSLVSDDFSSTQILVSIDVSQADAGKPEVIATLFKIRETAHQMFDGLASVYITGQPVMSATITESMFNDVIFLVPLVIVVLLGVLFFSFRRVSGVLLPSLTVVIAVVWSVGITPLAGIKLSLLAMVMPVILVAVGSAYGIHVVTHYFEETRNRTLSLDEHRRLVFTLMRRIMKPVFLAALTTLVGFVSFCFTPIVPMQEFGIISTLGVIFAFVVAVTFIPACCLIRGPVKPKREDSRPAGAEAKSPQPDPQGGFFSIMRRKRLVLVLAALITCLAVYGSSKLIIDNVVVEYFNADSDIARSDRFIRERFGGSKDVVLVLQADTTEALLDPKVLGAMDDLSTTLMERNPLVGKVVGFTDMIKRINQVFNADESPEGIRAAQPYDGPEDDTFGFGFGEEDFGFGFGDDFGFDDDFGFGGDFGFDDDYPAWETMTEAPGESGNAEILAAPVSAADLLAMLDTASAASSAVNVRDLIRDLKRQTNYEGMAYYEIPRNPAKYGKTNDAELEQIIANYLALLSGGSQGYSNDPVEPTAIKSLVQLRTVGRNDTAQVLDTIGEYAEEIFPPTVRFLQGGGSVLEVTITDLVTQAQLITIAFSVVMVFIIIALSNRSLVAGLIGSVPIVIAILCNFAVMGFAGIKLNIGTAIIASLIVGIGIDYTIHFMDSFKREYLARKDGEAPDAFLHRAFLSSGRAIIVNAVSVGAGFAVLVLSSFSIISDVGILVAVAMLITALLSLTVIPALLLLVQPKFIYGTGSGSDHL
ncbi:MAG: MMPL family transporter [Treponema sp.]|jgi:predicted RND superfamily exporter protein|nr:MMPL family transporter [Treponema sp.]